MEKKDINFKGVLRIPRVSMRSKFLIPSLSAKQDIQNDLLRLALEEQMSFMPPLPSDLTTRMKALDPDIVQLIKDEFVRFLGSMNISVEKFHMLIKPMRKSHWKRKHHSSSSSEHAFRGRAIIMSPYLKTGPHTEELLRKEKELDDGVEEENRNFKTNSPRLLKDSSGTLPIKKPRSRFLSTFFDEGSHGFSNLSLQLRDMVQRGTNLFEKFFVSKPLEKVHYRARELRQSTVLPLQAASKSNARWLFRMDVEDTIGMTAFHWQKWIHNRLSKHKVIAKNIVNSVIRFSIPNDLHSLERLSVVEYLETYCDIDKDRMVIYETFYSRMRQMIVNISSLKETALKLISTNLTEKNLEEFISLLNLPEDYAFKGSFFCRCLGLCERLYIPTVRSTDEKGGISMDDAESWKFQAGPLERLDFTHLSQRLRDLKIEPALKQLLIRLEKQMNSQSVDFFGEAALSGPSQKVGSRLFKRTRQSIRPPSESIRRGPTIRIVRH